MSEGGGRPGLGGKGAAGITLPGMSVGAKTKGGNNRGPEAVKKRAGYTA